MTEDEIKQQLQERVEAIVAELLHEITTRALDAAKAGDWAPMEAHIAFLREITDERDKVAERFRQYLRQAYGVDA